MANWLVTYYAAWQGTGVPGDPYRPEDIDCQSCVDITTQPVENILPAPNVLVVQLVVDDVQLTALDPAKIITQEEIVNESV